MTEEDLDCLEPDETFPEDCEDDDARVQHQKGNSQSNCFLISYAWLQN